MIDTGNVGALAGNLNNGWFGVLKASSSENGKIPVITEWIDGHSVAPDVIASSTLKSQAKIVVGVVKDVIDGSFKGKHYQFGLTPDWGPVMAKTDLLPQKIYDKSLAIQSKIVSKEIKPKQITECPK